MRLHATLALALLLATGSLLAVTPLTPRLTDSTRRELEARLTALGAPEVGHSSVVISVAAALGFEPKSNRYDYDMASDHLPQATAQSTPGAPGCADVVLTARYQTPPLQLRVVGTYCLVGAAEWQATRQTVTRDAP